MPETIDSTAPVLTAPAGVPEGHHRAASITVIVVLALAIAGALGWVIPHLVGQGTPADAAGRDASHLSFGQTYQTATGIAITMSAPFDDGTGHLVAYVTEDNRSHHAYPLTNQSFQLGDSVVSPALPNKMLYPRRQVTYRLAFNGTAVGPITYHPAYRNEHNIPLTWAP